MFKVPADYNTQLQPFLFRAGTQDISAPTFPPFYLEQGCGQHTRRVCENRTSGSVCLGLRVGSLLCELGGLTSIVMETGSRMERAVSSSLERAQEKSSRPSIEQSTAIPLLGLKRSLNTSVPWGKLRSSSSISSISTESLTFHKIQFYVMGLTVLGKCLWITNLLVD